MELFDAIRRRRSIRKFQPTRVHAELLTQILEAANLAPSAGNLQAYRMFVVDTPEKRRLLVQATGNQACVAEAPVVLLFCADPARSAVVWGAKGEQLLCVQDATIACAYAQLAATALGLASVWIGASLEAEAVKEALQLEERLWPVVLLPIGYAAETPPSRSRRPLKELVRAISRG